jgi:hypothetical protein
MRRMTMFAFALVIACDLASVAILASTPTVATFYGTSCPAGVYAITALASDLAGHNYPSLPVSVTLPAAQVQVPWPNLPPGQYSALARAQHADGRAWTSQLVSVTGLGDPIQTPAPDPVVTPVPTPVPIPVPPAPPQLPAGSQTLLTTQIPAAFLTDGVSYELGVRLVADVVGQFTAIRFWKAPTETAGTTHVGHIWTATGELLATATFTNETSSGWQQQALVTPVSVAANTEYVVSVNTADYFADTQQAFMSVLVNGHLQAPAGANGAHGGPGTFPTATYASSNYFRDVAFVPGQAASAASLDQIAILSAIDLSTSKILAALAPNAPATVPCAIVSLTSYANGDQKVTCRAPASGFTVGQILKVVK